MESKKQPADEYTRGGRPSKKQVREAGKVIKSQEVEDEVMKYLRDAEEAMNIARPKRSRE